MMYLLIFIGSLENLLPYETERQRHAISIIGAINGLNSLFSTETFPVVLARTMGLTITDSVPMIKVKFQQFNVKGYYYWYKLL